MADDKTFKNPNVLMMNVDEFHRASTIWPVHHPIIDGQCHLDDEECSFSTFSITENYYASNNDFTSLEKF